MVVLSKNDCAVIAICGAGAGVPTGFGVDDEAADATDRATSAGGAGRGAMTGGVEVGAGFFGGRDADGNESVDVTRTNLPNFDGRRYTFGNKPTRMSEGVALATVNPAVDVAVVDVAVEEGAASPGSGIMALWITASCGGATSIFAG